MSMQTHVAVYNDATPPSTHKYVLLGRWSKEGDLGRDTTEGRHLFLLLPRTEGKVGGCMGLVLLTFSLPLGLHLWIFIDHL